MADSFIAYPSAFCSETKTFLLLRSQLAPSPFSTQLQWYDLHTPAPFTDELLVLQCAWDVHILKPTEPAPTSFCFCISNCISWCVDISRLTWHNSCEILRTEINTWEKNLKNFSKGLEKSKVTIRYHRYLQGRALLCNRALEVYTPCVRKM